jgi:hypothetical protein
LSFDVNIISRLDFWRRVIIHDGYMEMHGKSVCVGVREVVQGKGGVNDEEGWRCFDGRKKKGRKRRMATVDGKRVQEAWRSDRDERRRK